jgi:hypothetical protein
VQDSRDFNSGIFIVYHEHRVLRISTLLKNLLKIIFFPVLMPSDIRYCGHGLNMVGRLIAIGLEATFLATVKIFSPPKNSQHQPNSPS